MFYVFLTKNAKVYHCYLELCFFTNLQLLIRSLQELNLFSVFLFLYLAPFVFTFFDSLTFSFLFVHLSFQLPFFLF